MCVTAMVAMTVASTGIAIHGQRQQAKAAKAQAEYNAQVAENNAIIARQNAEYEADRHDDGVRRLLASMRASQSATGVTRTGTSLDLQLDQVSQAEMDKLEILYTGGITEQGHKQSASSQRAMGEYQASQAKSNIGTSLLTGATGIAGIYKTNNGDLGLFNKQGRDRLFK